MSIHAELNPEVRAKLNAQRRNSTLSSIGISILAIVVLGLILAFIFLEPLIKETPVIVTYSSDRVEEKAVELKKTSHQIQKRPSAPSASMAKVIVSNASSPTALPVPDFDVPEPSADFGDSDDFGDDWGASDGGIDGGGFEAIPATMNKRCSPEDRMQRLLSSGGTEACETSVIKGLDWLLQTQNPDGSWTESDQAAMTGLALLAYLGHCETPISEKYGDSVLKAITWLVNLGMQQNGRLSKSPDHKHIPYEHAIATYAIAEAATFCNQLRIKVPNLDTVTQKAGQYIIDHQHQSGGWDYGFDKNGNRGGDLSLSAWMIQALKACNLTGLEFKRITLSSRQALSYVGKCQQRDGGFSYRPNGEFYNPSGYRTLTGAGMLCYQMWDKGASKPVRDGENYIIAKSKFKYDTPNADLYGHYYEAQAMIARGGVGWERYNNMIRDEYLNHQNDDGSWKAPNNGTATGMDAVSADSLMRKHYRTCLAILTMEVYYRFLPSTGSTR